MINIKSDTILSLFNEKGTLLKWLQKVEAALRGDTLAGVTIEQSPTDLTQVKLNFNFNDGSTLTSAPLTLAKGENGKDGTGIEAVEALQAYIAGNTTVTPIKVTLTDGTSENVSVIAQNGENGVDGKDGTDGNGIVSITTISAGAGEGVYEGYTETKINLDTDTETMPFEVYAKNGTDGKINSRIFRSSWVSAYIAEEPNYIAYNSVTTAEEATEGDIIITLDGQYWQIDTIDIDNNRFYVSYVTRVTGIDNVSVIGTHVINNKTVTMLNFYFTNGTIKQINIETQNGVTPVRYNHSINLAFTGVENGECDFSLSSNIGEAFSTLREIATELTNSYRVNYKQLVSGEIYYATRKWLINAISISDKAVTIYFWDDESQELSTITIPGEEIIIIDIVKQI